MFKKVSGFDFNEKNINSNTQVSPNYFCDTCYFTCNAKVLRIEKFQLFYIIVVESTESKSVYKIFSEDKLSKTHNALQVGDINSFCIRAEHSIQVTPYMKIIPTDKIDFSLGGRVVLQKGEIPYSAKNLIGIDKISTTCQ